MVRRGKCGSLHLRQVRYFMETGKYMSSVHRKERNGIRRASRSFTFDADKMYYIGSEGTEKRLVLFTTEEKQNAFEECHVVRKFRDHHGRTKTLLLLKEKYYWTSMVEDTVAMMVQCKSCKLNKLKINSRFIRVTQPWEVVSFDILGQFRVTDGGQAFLAIIIDMFTKYSVAIPLRDTTVVDIAAALEKSVFLFGMPRKFVTDQSEEFVWELNHVLQLDKGLPKNIMAITKIQMNRPDEASIKEKILQHCHEKESTWTDSLQKKVYEINSSFRTSSGHAPFYLMFHRHPNATLNQDDEETPLSKPTFVVRDMKRYLAERDTKAKDLAKDVFREHSSKLLSGGIENQEEKEENANDLSTSEHFHSKSQSDDHGYQRVTQNVQGKDAEVECDTGYAEASDELMLPDSSRSVYDMADGEGQVVVVTDAEDGMELAGQQMVIVQPSLCDQGLIKLGAYGSKV